MRVYLVFFSPKISKTIYKVLSKEGGFFFQIAGKGNNHEVVKNYNNKKSVSEFGSDYL